MAWQDTYQQDLAAQAQRVGQLPYTPFGQSTVSEANPWQQQAWQSTYQRGMEGSPEVSAARNTLTNTINGGAMQQNPYLQGDNPFLQSTIDSTLGDITKNYNQTIRPAMGTAQARSGSFGNAGLQEMQASQEQGLAQELGRASSNLRYGDYQNRSNLYESGLNRQQQAALGAPSFSNVDYTDLQAMQQAGNAAQGQSQNELTGQYNQYLDARSWPFSTLSAYSSGLGGNTLQQTAQTPTANRGANVLGGALAGAQLGGSTGIGSGWGALIGGGLGLLG